MKTLTQLFFIPTTFCMQCRKLAISVKGNRTAAFRDCSAEAKIISPGDGSLGDGMVANILLFSYDQEDRLTDVQISWIGRFVVTTTMKTGDFGQNCVDWGVLTDDVLWDIDLGERTFQSPLSQFSAISSQCNIAMFIQCDHFDGSCWSNNTYSITTVSLPEGRYRILDFPQRSEFVETPRILTQNTIGYLVSIVQTDRMTIDQETNLELARWSEIRLFVKILSGSKDGGKLYPYPEHYWRRGGRFAISRNVPNTRWTTYSPLWTWNREIWVWVFQRSDHSSTFVQRSNSLRCRKRRMFVSYSGYSSRWVFTREPSSLQQTCRATRQWHELVFRWFIPKCEFHRYFILTWKFPTRAWWQVYCRAVKQQARGHSCSRHRWEKRRPCICAWRCNLHWAWRKWPNCRRRLRGRTNHDSDIDTGS